MRLNTLERTGVLGSLLILVCALVFAADTTITGNATVTGNTIISNNLVVLHSSTLGSTNTDQTKIIGRIILGSAGTNLTDAYVYVTVQSTNGGAVYSGFTDNTNQNGAYIELPGEVSARPLILASPNQDVQVYPGFKTGGKKVSVYGNMQVQTNFTFTASGPARFEQSVRVNPSGDLSMGTFTNSPPP